MANTEKAVCVRSARGRVQAGKVSAERQRGRIVEGGAHSPSTSIRTKAHMCSLLQTAEIFRLIDALRKGDWAGDESL
eukprot:6176713-Pleurochrysis_carterae.AAC.2